MVEKCIQWVEKITGINKKVIVYVVSGILSLAIDYFVFIMLYYLLRTPVEVAAPLGLTAGLVTSFLMNRLWTFRDQASKGRKQTAAQITLYMLLFTFNNVFTVVFINYASQLGLVAALSKILATTAITSWNYLLYKKFIFR